MPRISRVSRVAYSPAQMFHLIKDVDSYPQFLPWCDAASVREENEAHQVASVSINKRLKQSTFITRNRLQTDRAIHVTLVDGPFRYLRGSWRFDPVEGGTRVLLDIDFEFSSRILSGLISPAFRRVCDTLVAAFVKRADAIYG